MKDFVSVTTARPRHADAASLPAIAHYVSRKFIWRGAAIFLAVAILSFASAAQNDAAQKAHNATVTVTPATNQASADSTADPEAAAPLTSSATVNNSSSDQNASSSNSSKPSISVTVNGHAIDVPENGSSQQTVTSQDGNTSVNISSHQSTTGSSQSFTSTSTNTQSNQNSGSSVSNVTIETQSGAP